MAAHARLGEQSGQRFGCCLIADLFQRHSHGSVMGKGHRCVEGMELMYQSGQRPRIASSSQRENQSVYGSGQVSVFGHLALENSGIPPFDRIERFGKHRHGFGHAEEP
jgi:hypothetical protein